MKKSLLALAMSLAAVSGAQASWFSGYNAGDPQLGNGEAIFVAFDDVAGTSYVQDLGVRYNDLVSGTAFNGQSFSLNLGVFAGSTQSNVRWTVLAGSGQYINDDFTDADYTKYGLLTTIDKNATPVTVPAQTTIVSNGLGAALSGIEVNSAMYSGAIADNGSVSESTAFGPKYVGGDLLAGYVPAAIGQDSLGAISGETMNLWRYGFADIYADTSVVNKLGSITLSGNTLKLDAAAPQVPVPAAAWLLGSALAGLGGIARRRNKAQ